MDSAARALRPRPFSAEDDFFRPIQLGEQHLTKLRNEAAEAVDATRREYNKYQQARGTYLVDRPPWRLHAEHGGLHAYTREHNSRPRWSSSRIFGTLQGNFRDIAGFFKTDSSADYLDVTKMLYKYAVDARVLHVISHSTSATSEAIKWVAFDAFWIRYRLDSCHFESMGTGVDANGKPYAFRAIIPAILPEVPDLYNSTRTVRVYHKSVILITPSDRSWNSSELFISTQNDFNGVRVPRRFYKTYLANLRQVMTFVDNRRIAVAQKACEPERSETQCSVCSRSFTFLRPRHVCSACGESVCRKCFVKRSEVLHVKDSPKFCTPCVQRSRQPDEQVSSAPVTECVETSYDRFLASHIREGLSSSRGGRACMSTYSRARLGTDASLVTDASSSHHSELSTPNEYSPMSSTPTITAIRDDGGCMDYIEEPERANSQSVIFTVDTSKATRVCEEPPITRMRHSTFSSAPSAFHTIHSSLCEQRMLLRELQASVRAHRATHKARMHISDL